MGIAPAQPDNPARRHAERELRTNLAMGPQSWVATYRPVNVVYGTTLKTVPVQVSASSPVPWSAGGDAGSLSGRSAASPMGKVQESRQGFVMVMAVGADEAVSNAASGVGDGGGVVELRAMDVFTVPGEAVGRAGGSVEITVRRILNREGPCWHGEVTW